MICKHLQWRSLPGPLQLMTLMRSLLIGYIFFPVPDWVIPTNFFGALKINAENLRDRLFLRAGYSPQVCMLNLELGHAWLGFLLLGSGVHGLVGGALENYIIGLEIMGITCGNILEKETVHALMHELVTLGIGALAVFFVHLWTIIACRCTVRTVVGFTYGFVRKDIVFWLFL